MNNVNSKKPVILLAFANDADRPLRGLAVEQDELVLQLDAVRRGGVCEIITIAAANAEKIIDAFQRNRGQVVIFHFGGHADGETLLLRSKSYGEHRAKALDLANFLATQPGLQLFFINGCLSLKQAQIYRDAGVKSVIVTDKNIKDTAAIKFAKFFYQSLANGASISEAFSSAITGFGLKDSGHDSPDTRSLLIRPNEDNDATPWKLLPAIPNNWRLPTVPKFLGKARPGRSSKKPFWGRDEDLQNLADILNESSRPVLINGLGGIGKTTLALTYIWKYEGQYDHIVWINQSKNFIQEVALDKFLASSLHLPFIDENLPPTEENLKARFEEIMVKLHHLKGRNLLIIDGGQKELSRKDIYDTLPAYPYWSVLVTSRIKLGGFDLLPLKVLDPGSCKSLFLSYYEHSFKDSDLEVLLSEIGYHTLTVELVARLLNGKNPDQLGIPDIVRLLKEGQMNDLQLQNEIWSDHSREEQSVFSHLIRLFELSAVSKEERWLLKQFLALSPEYFNPEVLSNLLETDASQLERLLKDLVKSGWLSRSDTNDYSIHPLVQTVLRYQIDTTVNDIETLMKNISRELDKSAFEFFNNDNGLLWKSALEMERFFGDEEDLGVARLIQNIGNIYFELGEYKNAMTFNQKALLIKQIVLESNHPDLLDAYNSMAENYRVLGQFENAIDHHQMVLQAATGERNSDMVRYYQNTAETYRLLGKFKEALPYDQKALEIAESILDPQSIELASVYNSLALTYNILGESDKAIHYNRKDQAILEAILDQHHPRLAASYNTSALIYDKIGKYETALEYSKKIWQF